MRCDNYGPDSGPGGIRWVCSLFALALALSACGDDASNVAPPPPRELAAEVAQKQANLRAVGDKLVEYRNMPWFQNTAMSAAIGSAARYLGVAAVELDELERIVAADGATRPQIESRLDRVDEDIRTWAKRLVALDEVFAGHRGKLLEAYGQVSAANRRLAALVDSGVPCPDEQAPMREITSQYEEGLRRLAAAMGRRLVGDEVDEGREALGMGQLGKAGEAAQPFAERLRPVENDLLALNNGLEAIPRRLEWVRQTLARLPEDDPWRAEPESSLANWEARWTPVRDAALAARRRILDRSRENVRAIREQADALAGYLRELNRVFIEKARAAGLPLPDES